METIRIVEECLNPRHGETRGLRKIAPDKEKVKEHIQKAENNLRAMELLYKNKFFDWTVIAGYYAMYHAVLSALRTIGLLGLTHRCSLNAFKTFFVERGKIENKFLEYLDRAKKLETKYVETIEKASKQRVIVQYRVVELHNEDVAWILNASREFVERILRIVVE